MTSHSTSGKRWLRYGAFVVAFIGAQACVETDKTPPPFGSSGRNSTTPTSPNGVGDELGESAPPSHGEGEEVLLEPEEGAPLEAGDCTVTFKEHILPIVRDQWRCGSSECHANPKGNKPLMDTTNEDALYTLFAGTVVNGKKLVDTSSTSPADSALFCLLQGTCGPRMPRQGATAPWPERSRWWRPGCKCKAPRGRDAPP
jgi:hypothetical protein